MPPLPALEDDTIKLADLIFGGNTEACPLPCWYGAEIGHAERSDVEGAFYTAFELPPSSGLLIDNPPDWGMSDPEGRFSSHVAGQNWWFFDGDTEYGYLHYRSFIDVNSGKLRAQGFEWSFGNESTIVIDLTPQEILDNLGAPDGMYAAVYQTSVSYRGQLNLLFQYLQGITFSFTINVPIFPTQNGYVLEYCLDNLDLQDDWSNRVTGKFFVMEPIPEPLARTEPLEWWLYGWYARDWELQPIEDVFELTAAEVTAWAQYQNNACLFTSVEY